MFVKSMGCDQVLFKESGAGAAGGLGFGLRIAAGASFAPGFSLVSAWLGLEEQVADADLVITGEGCVDGQSGEGKLVAGVQAVCAQADVPLVVVAGQTTEAGRQWCDDRGLIVIELGERCVSLQERIRRAPELLEQAGRLVMSRFVALP